MVQAATSGVRGRRSEERLGGGRTGATRRGTDARARMGSDTPGWRPDGCHAGGVFARVRAATHLAGGRASEGRGRAPTSVRREVGRVAPPQGKRGRWGGRRRHKAGTGVREGGAWRTAANPTSRFACFNRVVKGDKAMGISVFSLGVFSFSFFSTV